MSAARLPLHGADLGGYSWVNDDDNAPVQWLAFQGFRRYRIRVAVAQSLQPPGSNPMRDQPFLHCLGAFLRQLKIAARRSEEHTSELQSRVELVCRLLLET